MSADDWVCCPKCKTNFKEFVKKCYGKISEEQFSLLKQLEELYDSESGDLDETFTEDDMAIMRDIEIQQKFDFIPENEHDQRIIETVRYDADSALCEDGLLHISESYWCQFCGAEWHVLQKFSEGKNNLFKELKNGN